MITTPTLLILYNRPDKTKQLLTELNKIKPQQLYIFCDGPKNTKDKTKTAMIHNLVKSISWTKNVEMRIEKKNLGCKKGVSTAISWFFANEKQGVILEDDCIPNASFFKFSSELLEKYKNDGRISLIAGTNSNASISVNDSYFFSTYSNIWGWASWADRWQSFSWLDRQGLSLLKSSEVLHNLALRKVPKGFIANTIDSLLGTLDTWDYIWTMSNILNNRLAIIPTSNMISNIGFGMDSTHTKIVTNQANIEREDIKFPLSHPEVVMPNAEFDSQKRRKHIKTLASLDFAKEKLLKMFSF